MRARILAGALVAALAAAAPAAAHARHHHHKRFVKAQLLSINDFHGNIEANTPGTIREDTPAGPAIPAGGAEHWRPPCAGCAPRTRATRSSSRPVT